MSENGCGDYVKQILTGNHASLIPKQESMSLWGALTSHAGLKDPNVQPS